ncbi:hypothetical protein [Micromonospora robiginosa]|uniref:Uncharacterized protein n=1 Tax=Micromonospora robiginosa TaxID=2749844 RepID=A0A7L6B3N5_9ACTN|nr:hypothetical protein [Micromonospora ferruginea]QLQ36598.1 hypothetical protein H1D33_25535 [Micromonospora ferruginea]
MRRTLPILAALTLLGLPTGCGPGPTATSAGAPSTGATGIDASTGTQTPDAPASPTTGDESSADPATQPTTTAAKPAAPPAPKAPKVPALTCAQLSGADLGSPTAPFYDHTDHIPLTDGVWNGEDGTGVELRKPCAVGDLDGDKAADAARAVLVRTGGTGQFWSLVFWGNTGGKPAYRAVVDLGDRTPVTSVAVAGQKATVVWLTRSADASMAELNVRRTTVYKLTGSTVTEVSHADAPYTP